MAHSPNPVRISNHNVPFELYRNIAEHLSDDGSKSDLINLSLASHAWRHESERVLWSKVTIKLPECPDSFLVLLENKFASFVRSLDVRLYPDSAVDGVTDTGQILPSFEGKKVLYARVVALIRRMQPSITSLQILITKPSLSRINFCLLSSNLHFPRLTSFHFRATNHNYVWVENEMPQFLLNHPKLEHISVFDGHDDRYMGIVQGMLHGKPTTFLNLKTLSTTAEAGLRCSYFSPAISTLKLLSCRDPFDDSPLRNIGVREVPSLREIHFPAGGHELLSRRLLSRLLFPELREAHNVNLRAYTGLLRHDDKYHVDEDRLTWTPRSLRVLSCYIPPADFPETLDEVDNLLDKLDPFFLKLERLLIHDRKDRLRFLNCTLSIRGVRTISGYIEGTTHQNRKTLTLLRQQVSSSVSIIRQPSPLTSTITNTESATASIPLNVAVPLRVGYRTFAPRTPRAPVRFGSDRDSIDLALGLFSAAWFIFFVLVIMPMFGHCDTK
ncbi:hypothetical protein SISNIDRAFT_459855 [Sistotremastrum niveocremeum HHB9708]|uniref:F-box domain-containing protein n=1 Tax=Sistotremastrum niveocremeum HHB9708 TaxID=1314777 RepID=A0A164P5R0_9AGAM|nr:hypothetical protein SISNIDRAFT_459855 [Sistotremastrum niveocremeum HHB9708]